jgi:hypothetical protein
MDEHEKPGFIGFLKKASLVTAARSGDWPTGKGKLIAGCNPPPFPARSNMEQNVNGGSDPTRLDRIERIIEVLATTQMDMQQDLKIVLRAQVVMTDHMEKLTARIGTLAEQMEQLAEAQKHTDKRMDALIVTVDEIIRKRE